MQKAANAIFTRGLDQIPSPVHVGASLDELARLVAGGGVMVLSGAGLSTESGIPDYRGPTGLQRRATPMQYKDFVGDPVGRRRYWARSFLGWRHIAGATPNAGHRAVAQLEAAGLVSGVVTQNVDGLHQVAGAREVIELHGNLARVVCLSCSALTPRHACTKSPSALALLETPVRAVVMDTDGTV